MNFEDIHFPVYRKYKNNKSYFKIINPRQFEQIQLFGSKKSVTLIDANMYPEMNFIRDLVYNAEMADEIAEAEYLQKRN